MTTSQKRRKNDPNNLVQLRTPGKLIVPSKREILLGAWIHQDLKWEEHIQNNEESLLRSLNKRLGALKLVCRIASFKTRKDIANGIFLSKLSYLIALWGGCTSTLLRSLQILQNKAARTVTKLDWSTNTSVLLNQCGWLSVHQLVVYHSVLQVYKVMQTKKPKSLHSMFKTEYSRNTREALSGQIKQEGSATKKVRKVDIRSAMRTFQIFWYAFGTH